VHRPPHQQVEQRAGEARRDGPDVGSASHHGGKQTGLEKLRGICFYTCFCCFIRRFYKSGFTVLETRWCCVSNKLKWEREKGGSN
jgi:hypothetical protein